jgi:hypothetical protein
MKFKGLVTVLAPILMLGSANMAQATDTRAAAPSPNTGEGLWTMCGKTASGSPPKPCTAYVSSIILTLKNDQLLELMHVCLNAATDAQGLNDLTNLVRRYLSNHPGDRHYAADSLVSSALLEKYSCPAGQSK